MVWVIAVAVGAGWLLGLYFRVFAVALASLIAVPAAIYASPLIDAPHPLLVVPAVTLVALQVGFLAGALSRHVILRLRSLDTRLPHWLARRR
jgi:hypothetical protein